MKKGGVTYSGTEKAAGAAKLIAGKTVVAGEANWVTRGGGLDALDEDGIGAQATGHCGVKTSSLDAGRRSTSAVDGTSGTYSGATIESTPGTAPATSEAELRNVAGG